MALLARIYFNAVFGALGGLIGWMLYGVLGNLGASNDRQWLLGGLDDAGLDPGGRRHERRLGRLSPGTASVDWPQRQGATERNSALGLRASVANLGTAALQPVAVHARLAPT